jgi:hypothetical protein
VAAPKVEKLTRSVSLTPSRPRMLMSVTPANGWLARTLPGLAVSTICRPARPGDQQGVVRDGRVCGGVVGEVRRRRDGDPPAAGHGPNVRACVIDDVQVPGAVGDGAVEGRTEGRATARGRRIIRTHRCRRREGIGFDAGQPNTIGRPVGARRDGASEAGQRHCRPVIQGDVHARNGGVLGGVRHENEVRARRSDEQGVDVTDVGLGEVEKGDRDIGDGTSLRRQRRWGR